MLTTLVHDGSGVATTAPNTFRVKFPFVKVLAGSNLGDEPGEYYRWKPGVRDEEDINQVYGYCERIDTVADGEGTLVLVELSRHTPPHPEPGKRYATRVFYLRSFEYPDGHVTTPRMMVASVSSFVQKSRRYAREYELTTALEGVHMYKPYEFEPFDE